MSEANPVSKSESCHFCKNTDGTNKSSELLERPTRPLSAYNLFFRDQRKALIQTLPAQKASRNRYSRKRQCHHKISFSDLGKVIGSRWKNIGPSSLAVYEARANEEKRKYKIELEAWRKQQEALGLPTTKQQKKRKETSQGNSKSNTKQRALSSKKALQDSPTTMDNLEPLEFNPTSPDALFALPPEAKTQEVIRESNLEPVDPFGDAPRFSMRTTTGSTTIPAPAPRPNGPQIHESNQVGAMGSFAYHDHDHVHGYTAFVGQSRDATAYRASDYEFAVPNASFPNQAGTPYVDDHARNFLGRADDLDLTPLPIEGASVHNESISLPPSVNPPPIPSWPFGNASGQVPRSHSSATYNNCPRKTFFDTHTGLYY